MVTGFISFTAGVMVEAWSNNNWGWNNWGGGHWGRGPVVVYNHQTFVNRTIINSNHINWHPPYFGPGPVRNPLRFSGSGMALPVHTTLFNSTQIHPPVFHLQYKSSPEVRRYSGTKLLRGMNGLAHSCIREQGPAFLSCPVGSYRSVFGHDGLCSGSVIQDTSKSC